MRGYVTVMAINTVSKYAQTPYDRHDDTDAFSSSPWPSGCLSLGQLQKGANDFEVSCGPRSHQSVSLSRSQIILNSLTHWPPPPKESRACRLMTDLYQTWHVCSSYNRHLLRKGCSSFTSLKSSCTVHATYEWSGSGPAITACTEFPNNVKVRANICANVGKHKDSVAI